jgi:hypothetical protein
VVDHVLGAQQSRIELSPMAFTATGTLGERLGQILLASRQQGEHQIQCRVRIDRQIVRGLRQTTQRQGQFGVLGEEGRQRIDAGAATQTGRCQPEHGDPGFTAADRFHAQAVAAFGQHYVRRAEFDAAAAAVNLSTTAQGDAQRRRRPAPRLRIAQIADPKQGSRAESFEIVVAVAPGRKRRITFMTPVHAVHVSPSSLGWLDTRKRPPASPECRASSRRIPQHRQARFRRNLGEVTQNQRLDRTFPKLSRQRR